MSKQYENPPLKEAVCEFRFSSDSQWDLTIPGIVYAALKSEYPRKLINPPSGVSLTIGPGGAIRQRGAQFGAEVSPQVGLRFWWEDDQGSITIAPNRLSVSHVTPYPSWEGFLPIIMNVYNTYKGLAEPRALQRVGLRYINHIVFEEEEIDLDRSFNFYPFVGEGLPQNLRAFSCTAQIAYNNGRDILRLQMSSGGDTSTEIPAVVIDLDYFLAEPRGLSLDAAEEWLESAHSEIEKAFEACLTDEVRELFGEVKE